MEPKAKSRHMEPVAATADEQCVDSAATAIVPAVPVGHATNDGAADDSPNDGCTDDGDACNAHAAVASVWCDVHANSFYRRHVL